MCRLIADKTCIVSVSLMARLKDPCSGQPNPELQMSKIEKGPTVRKSLMSLWTLCAKCVRGFHSCFMVIKATRCARALIPIKHSFHPLTYT